MRKLLRHERRFAVGRRAVGKRWRAVERTASGKQGRESALVPAAVLAASATAEGQESGVD
jgi:hypothetical protein